MCIIYIDITFTYVYLNGTIELWNHLMISAWWNPYDCSAPSGSAKSLALPVPTPGNVNVHMWKTHGKI